MSSHVPSAPCVHTLVRYPARVPAPSFDHEIIRQLFENRPALAAELLAALRVAIPEYDTATIESSDLSQIVPAQFHADVVTLFSAGDPVVTDREVALRDPELAVLSALSHGGGDEQLAIDVALAAVEALAAPRRCASAPVS